jgi:hypothetical protein
MKDYTNIEVKLKLKEFIDSNFKTRRYAAEEHYGTTESYLCQILSLNTTMMPTNAMLEEIGLKRVKVIRGL